MNFTLFNDDCLSVLRDLPSDCLDSLVTDPPAGISFMGKAWDDDKGGRKQWVAWMTEVMQECHRVLKPGAHGLVWALPRTSHWTATALEDAGFEVRDVVVHLFGTGFPKSMDISKAIDKAARADREVIGINPSSRPNSKKAGMRGFDNRDGAPEESAGVQSLTAPATDAAKQWAGFGTALKPASEHWILIRKPCSEKTVAANVLKHGVGGLNIDGCRISAGEDYVNAGFGPRYNASSMPQMGSHQTRPYVQAAIDSGKPVKDSKPHNAGRFPANLILDEEAAAALDEQTKANNSRFFYVAKASKSDKGHTNTHPTVKSTALMRYLIKLVTPPGGVVLDPFMGSGTTGVSAMSEGMKFVGIEKDPEYYAICESRIALRGEE